MNDNDNDSNNHNYNDNDNDSDNDNDNDNDNNNDNDNDKNNKIPANRPRWQTCELGRRVVTRGRAVYRVVSTRDGRGVAGGVKLRQNCRRPRRRWGRKPSCRLCARGLTVPPSTMGNPVAHSQST